MSIGSIRNDACIGWVKVFRGDYLTPNEPVISTRASASADWTWESDEVDDAVNEDESDLAAIEAAKASGKSMNYDKFRKVLGL
jgi:hypothetical protein